MCDGNLNVQCNKKRNKDPRTMKMKFNLMQKCMKFIISNSFLKLSYSKLRHVGCVHVMSKLEFF